MIGILKICSMKVLLIGVALLSLFSCKDATRAQFNALNRPHRITQYAAGGNIIHQWKSTGSVSNEPNSDGWYFEDDSTRKLVEVTGTVVIEVE